MNPISFVASAIVLAALGALGVVLLVLGRRAMRSWYRAPFREPQPAAFLAGAMLLGISLSCLAILIYILLSLRS